MTQARSVQTISLLLTPMQLPEAAPAPATASTAATWTAESQQVELPPIVSLGLCPGEPSEMIVQIKNESDRSVELEFKVEGDFPLQWCQIGGEGSELRARHQMDAVLYFQIAADFFEQHQTPSVGKTLKLDYQGQLYVFATAPDTGQRQIKSTTFNLYVRPRSLYLNFLPSVYREVDFIGRFLKIFEQAFEPAVQTLDTLWAYLDPLTAPQTLLPFLAYWVGWPSDVPWSTQQQRRLIRHAMEIYRWRGTRQGLRLYLHLYTGLPLDEPGVPEAEKAIAIQEIFSDGFILGGARLGQEAILGGGRPYHFIVRLRAPEPKRIDERLVRTILDQEKPAFCTYDLYIEEAQIPVSSVP
ncbi:MAG TPA: phage tail protein [Allocoleopsis sp.]